MKKLAIVGALVVLAAGLVYWFAIRDRGGAKPGVTAGSGADPQGLPPPPRDLGDRGDDRRPSGPTPRMAFEVDPDGTLLLEGQVLDEHDDPVAGAEVRIMSSPPRTTTSDTDGSFSFDKLLGRTYHVRARAGDRIGGGSAKVMAKGDPLVIRLRVGATVTVTVTDAASRKAIAGATVLRLDDEEAKATTDADGKAVLRGVDDGWVRVSASAPGYGPMTANKRLGKSERTARLEVALTRGAPVSGRVVDERGQAVVGARVWAMDASNAWEGGAGERTAETTGKDGGFTIAALSAGSYLLFAKHEAHAPAVTAPVSVSGEAPTTGVTIVMKAAAVLAGVVVDRDARPVPYATVRLSSTTWSADMVYRQAAADDQGTFEIKGLPRVSLRIRAEGEQASSGAVDVDLASTPEKRDLKLVLDRSGMISGVVVDGDGEAVPEATVSAYPDFMAKQVDWIMASTATASTDGDGRFVLRGLDEGDYRVRAGRDGGGSSRSTGREGVATHTGAKDVRLVLPAPGGIKGRIALEDGDAPELATVSAGWEERVTVRDGVFTLSELRPGTYDVRVVGPSFAERVKAGIVVAEGKVTDAGTITVRAGRRIDGKVVDGKGAPVAGARVLYGKMLFGDGKSTGADDADTAAQMGMRTATTGAWGEFVLSGAPRTSGSLLAEHPTLGRSVAQKIPAGKDNISGVTITLRGYGSIAGKVMRKGEPVAGATVNAAPVGSSGQAVFVQSGQDGSFVIDRLPEGPTALSAMTQRGFGGGMGGSRSVSVVAGKQVDGTITLPAGDVTLKVKIEPKPGATLNLVQVFLFRGTVAARNGEEIMDAFLASGGIEGEEGDTSLALGGAAGMLIWLGGSPLSFEELVPGSYSVCSIPITGNIMDEALMQRIFRHLDLLEVYCKAQPIKATPTTQEITVSLPSMTPIPPEDEDE